MAQPEEEQRERRRGARYIVVEGVIGVGKTTLVTSLADALGGRAIFEAFEQNPFLPDFYRDRAAHALSTQLFFLMSRFRQQEELVQPELFRPHTISDYLFEKDRIFAELTLSPAELRIYEQLFEVLGPRVPRPDLVILLQAKVEVVLERIRARGRPYEASIDAAYLESLAEAYAAFFSRYAAAPVITVDTDRRDPRAGGPMFAALLEAIRSGGPSGALESEGAPLALPLLERGG